MNRLASELSPHLASNILNLIVMPTEQCNFRCTYCYEDFRDGSMPRTVVAGLMNFMTRRAPGLDQLTISWFGGEPLLAADVIERVQSHAQVLASRHSSMRLLASMTTNGFLLDPGRMTRLLELGVRQYQISFDGPQQIHDRKRVRVGGQGTFRRIWSNLEAAHELDEEFEILVRLHIDRENLHAMPAFLEQCRAAFGRDPRFKLFIRPLARLGGANDEHLSVLEATDGPGAVEKICSQARRLGLRHQLDEDQPGVCYAATANSFVVRSDGTLAKCTVSLSHPENRVGRLLEDGRVELDSAKMKQWMRGLFTGDPEERSCPMRGYADRNVS